MTMFGFLKGEKMPVCPICKGPLVEGAMDKMCAGCNTVYHRECLEKLPEPDSYTCSFCQGTHWTIGDVRDAGPYNKQ